MAKQRPKKASVDELAEQAKFVFRGTVIQRGAATLDQVPLTRDTLIVRVDEILDAPDVVAGFAGRDITVQLARGLRASTGQRYVFYTNGWLYGDGLAVHCVGLTPDSDMDLRTARRALETVPGRAIQKRAKQAELVVSGHVTEVREAPRPPRAPITEHDPQWRQAVVAVESVPRAASPTARKPKQVVIRFASSPDVRWVNAPKFAVGDTGIWMLGDKSKKAAAELRAAAGAQKSEFVVVDPEDFFPMEFSEQIRALVNKEPVVMQ